MTRIRTWFLVADDVKANIFVADAAEAALRPVPGTDFRTPCAARRLTPSKDAVDGQWDSPRRFAQRAAAYLEQAAIDARFDRLVLVAPRPMLGDLWRALGRDAARRLAALRSAEPAAALAPPL